MTASPGDCYKILGITRDATARQVKAAYRKLAKKHHLDACPGDPDAAVRFREITEAYETLFGWTVTTVPAATAQCYESQLAALADAMTFWREAEHMPGTKKRDTNLVAASCPCGRKIRVAASTLKEAPILCEACAGCFESGTAADA
jgi:hypothetical protein